MMMPTVK